MAFKRELLDFIKLHQSHGKNRVFNWNEEGMKQYIDWAFSSDYLFIVVDKFGISGVVIAYPIHKYEKIMDILPQEGLYDNAESPICIMDLICCNKNARIDITHKLMNRFTNWENRDKVSLRYGKIKRLPNRYFELTGGSL